MPRLDSHLVYTYVSGVFGLAEFELFSTAAPPRSRAEIEFESIHRIQQPNSDPGGNQNSEELRRNARTHWSRRLLDPWNGRGKRRRRRQRASGSVTPAISCAGVAPVWSDI